MYQLLLLTTWSFDIALGFASQRLPMVIKCTNQKGRFGSAAADHLLRLNDCTRPGPAIVSLN